MFQLEDKIRGMILLGAYGDSYGAKHELENRIHDEPFPERIPVRTIGNHHWGTWLPASQAPVPARAVPTDDTAFKLFILYPWMRDTITYDRKFDEESFKTFIRKLKRTPTQPDWVKPQRDAQIDEWLKMYLAESNNKPYGDFFKPNVPIVFGFFMFFELGAVRFNKGIYENYLHFKKATVLDQSYAKSATGFLCTLLARAYSADNSGMFDSWLRSETKVILETLKQEGVDIEEVDLLDKITSSMLEFGEKFINRSSHDFMIEFENKVVNSSKPPFMDSPFLDKKFDPFRFIAEIYAATSFAQGDPYTSIKTVSFGSGDTDTTATFMGTIMGAWYGQRALYKNDALFGDLREVQHVLAHHHEFDIEEAIQLFIHIYAESTISTFV